MKIKSILTIALTKRVLRAIEKIINLRCSIKGGDNIPKFDSIIFAPNHFTRFETFLLPYFLNKISDLKFSRSLADSSLFTSMLGKYLRNLKTMSIHDENRDETIISDLAEHKYNWVIYPEGKMVKDKHRETYSGIFKSRLSIKTGTAVLAMKAEFVRQERGGDHRVCIVPTTISYTPIHPKNNKILSIAKKFAKAIPKRLEEELLVEGSLLLNSHIIIHFHRPVYIIDYIKKDLYINRLFNSTKEGHEKSKISKYRIPIAIKIADEMYKHTQITHEHIISLLLYNANKSNGIKREDLKILLIACVLELRKHSNIKEFSANISGNKLFLYAIAGEESIDNFLTLLQKQKLIHIHHTHIMLTKKFFSNYDFNTVRVENISKIFLNEINYFMNTNEVAKVVLKMKNIDIVKICFAGIEEYYIHQHSITYNPVHSIKVQCGKPRLIMGRNDMAVLLIHGYKSSPREMNNIAEFLNTNGANCYNVRMEGHGTSPFDMANTTHEDWISSCEVSYNILHHAFANVNVIGFSTGGLVAMQIASKYQVRTLTLISSAMELCDIRFRYVKLATLWSDIASKFSKTHTGYIQDKPAYEDTNYSINHYSCMAELACLMEKCKDDMYKITSDTLIIQGNQDPVVHPRSANIIYEGVKSKVKILKMIDSDEHVITRGDEFKKIKDIIGGFLL